MTITISTNLITINCGGCAGTYAIQERYHAKKMESGGSWNCPYCQISWGFVESENQRLQRALDAKKRREEFLEQQLKESREACEAQERKTIAEKAAKTRIKNRIANGVCPCCKRSFSNLHQHMTTKHPDFTKEPAPAST